MDTIKLILSFVPLVLGAITAIVTFILSWKARAKAKTAEEKAAAELAMEQAAKSFIADAETLYKSVDDLLKARGQSAGSMKKETVMAKLQTYAIEKGYTLDVAAWSTKIDELVKFTKEVNSKK